MGRKQHNGLQISRSEITAVSACWLLPILSGAAIYALLELTGLAHPWLPTLIGIAVCGLALVLGKRKWFWSSIFATLLMVLVVCQSRFLDGFCQWYNILGRMYTAENGIVLTALVASDDIRNIHIFTCWLAAFAGMGMAPLSQWGNGLVGASVLMICGGVALSLGRMIDPLPLILAAATLCTGRGWTNHALSVGILTAAVLLSGIPGFSDWAGELSDAVRQEIHAGRYETKYTTLPEGRLEPIRRSDSVSLIVTMEKPEALYLRGFTGAQIEEDRWLPLDNQILAENQELLYWLNSREFDLRAQFEAAASILETQKNTVTVQNVGACSVYRYIPFTICGDDRFVPENLTDTATGTRYDSYTTVCGGAAMLSELLTALETENSRYLQAEAAYRDFVEDHYLSIPEELVEKMQPYWEKAEGMDAQAAVKAVLAQCYPDGIRYDPYYATAAVLTLRHFGIPARYAEGYILPQTTASTVELTGRHAACWAEVYQDGIGWLPMALTPSQDGETEQEEHQLLPPDTPEETLPPDTPEETLPPETEPMAEPEPDGGYQVRVPRVLLCGIVIGILLLIAVALILRRNYILKKRQAILNQEDIRESVVWSFASGIRTLERLGIHRGNGSLDALYTPIREQFGAELSELFETASRINAKALFSSHPLTETERAAVHGFRQCVLSCLQGRSSRLSRLWMKYILCIF